MDPMGSPGETGDGSNDIKVGKQKIIVYYSG